MRQKQLQIFVINLFTLTKWNVDLSAIGCSYICISLFNCSIHTGIKLFCFVPVFFNFSQYRTNNINKNLVANRHKQNNCFIFALPNTYNVIVLSFDFTVSKHHKGVVFLNSLCNCIKCVWRHRGCYTLFINENNFSNAKHRKKFTKHAYKWCVGNGDFTKRSRKSFYFTSRFTQPIATSLAQYPNNVQRRIYKTYFKHQPFIPFRLWRNFFYCVFRFKTAIAKQRYNSLTPPLLSEFLKSLCFNKHREKFARFY